LFHFDIFPFEISSISLRLPENQKPQKSAGNTYAAHTTNMVMQQLEWQYLCFPL